MLPQSLSAFRHRSVFVKWLLVFNILIIVSVSVVGSISYRTSSTLLLEEATTSSSMYMEQARDNIDKEIIVLDHVTQQISLQTNLRRVLYASGGIDGSQSVIYAELVKYLSSVKMSNPMLQSIWIDATKEPSIISSEAKYERAFFYQHVYPTQPQVDWTKSLDKQFGLRSLGRFISNGIPMIIFARPVPMEEIPYRGAIYASVNEHEFASRINSTKLGASNGIFVTNSKGDIILKNNGVPTEEISGVIRTILVQGDKEGSLYESIDGKQHLIVYASSKVNDWRYISMIPIETIMEKVNRIQKVTIFAVLICLIAGLVLSYFLIARIYEPINQMIQYINLMGVGEGTQGGVIQKQDELSFINQLINTVHDRYESLKDTFDKQVPLLRQKLLYDLIEGRLSTNSITETLSMVKLKMPYDTFQILVFESVDFNLDEPINVNGESVMQIFDEQAVCITKPYMNVYALRKRNDKVVTIVNLDPSEIDLEAIYDYAEHMKTFFEKNYNRTFTVGIGRLCFTYKDIPISYLDALSALRYKIVKGQGEIIFVDEIHHEPNIAFSYSIDTEKKIINQIKTANMDQVIITLTDVVERNIRVNESTPETIDNLFKALAGTAIRTIYEIEARTEDVLGAGYNLYAEIDNCQTAEDMQACINRAYEAISRYVNSRTENQYEQLLVKIKDYVENHYHEELSLPQLGETLKMSPTYLSGKFKEITGMKFVDFVNTRRIEQAKLYLREGDDSVNDISERVGFVNANTFIKVFKKHEGVTPGQFRSIK
jgi:two-component system response regulator YesN